MYNRGLLPIIVCTNDDPGVNLTYFTTRSNLVLWEKVKTVDFSESTAPCDLKVCRCRQLIEFMKVYVSIEGQGHFLTLAQGHVCMKIKTCFSHWAVFNQILYVSFYGNKNSLMGCWSHDQWWQPCQYMVKTLSKSSSPVSAGWFPRNLVCSIKDFCPSWFIQMMALE